MHKPTPEGFTIGFHPRGRWGWKREFLTPANTHVPPQAKGYRSRRDALRALEEALLTSPADAPDPPASHASD